MMWFLVVGAVCLTAAVVAVSAAGRASGSAWLAVKDAARAGAAAADAEISAGVARTVTGIDYSFSAGEAAASDPSHRIWQDLRIAAATAQRINYRVATPRTRPTSHADVFVKPTTSP